MTQGKNQNIFILEIQYKFKIANSLKMEDWTQLMSLVACSLGVVFLIHNFPQAMFWFTVLK